MLTQPKKLVRDALAYFKEDHGQRKGFVTQTPGVSERERLERCSRR